MGSQSVSAAGERKDSVTAGSKALALHYGRKEEDLTSTAVALNCTKNLSVNSNLGFRQLF